jgi:anti-anti-sigma factor
LTLTLREHDEPTRLVVDGEIDVSTAREFADVLSHAAAGHDRIVVDLTAVDFLGGAGVEVLDAHSDHIAAVLVGMRTPHAPALTRSGLDSLVARRPAR